MPKIDSKRADDGEKAERMRKERDMRAWGLLDRGREREPKDHGRDAHKSGDCE